MGLQLTVLFEDNFTIDSASSPISTVNWHSDVNSPSPVTGDLQTAPDGPNGEMVADGDLSQQEFWDCDWFDSYWNGDCPDDCFVRLTIGAYTTDGAFALFYRTKQYDAGIDNDGGSGSGGYGYYLNITPNSDSGTTAIVRIYCKLASNTNPLELGTITIDNFSPGDSFTAVAIGTTHYAIHNGTVLFTATDSNFTKGGVGTTAIGFTNYETNVTTQFLDVQIGSASNEGMDPSGLSNHLDNSIRGLRG